MRRQLMLFHEALAAYFSGNRVSLETALKPFIRNNKLATAANSP